jgi:hypothetical protein
MPPAVHAAACIEVITTQSYSMCSALRMYISDNLL